MNILIFNPYLIIKDVQFTDWYADSETFVRDTLVELWFCATVWFYKLIWAGLYPYSFFNLGKNHQLTTDVYDLQPAKSPTQFSAILSFCFNMLF